MRTNYLKYLFLIIGIPFVIISCQKSDSLNTDIPGLGGDSWSTTSIDQWISDTLTDIYNIQVKYRFDRSELDVNKTLIPADESKVIPIMSMVNKVFLQPYGAEGGETFIKTMTPKQFILVGSPSYNSNGSITIGQAEGGKKITLFEVNDYSSSNRAVITRICHTIEHEFGHILNQTRLYNTAFRTVTPESYTSDWTNQNEDFNNRGFITQYSQASPDEDFVEVLATLLVEGQEYFDSYVKNTDANGAAKLRLKESYVRDYMKNTWNIDLYSLQNRIKNAINTIAPLPGVYDLVGQGQTYPFIGISNSIVQSTPFSTSFKYADSVLRKNINYKIDSLSLAFDVSGKMALFVKFTSVTTAANTYYANFIYSIYKDAFGRTFQFNYLSTDGTYSSAYNSNANFIGSYITQLTNYFSSTFTSDWNDGYNYYSIPTYGIFKKTTNTQSYFIGKLIN